MSHVNETQLGVSYRRLEARATRRVANKEGLPTIEVIGGQVDVYVSNQLDDPGDTLSNWTADGWLPSGVVKVDGRTRWIRFEARNGSPRVFTEGLIDFINLPDH